MSEQTSIGTATEARVASVSDLAPGSMKLAKVGEHRVVVIRTADGFHALDNACPHQGYGLATGALDGDLLTCQWHNWKYNVKDGSCVVGEEDVPCHAVRVEGEDVLVTVVEPSDEDKREALWPSLISGIDRNYSGQIARDVARLLQAGANPDEILSRGLAFGLPRTEWGMGHEMAVAADLIALATTMDGLDRTLPLTQALSGVAEETRGRPERKVPRAVDAPAERAVFLNAIESEDWATACAALRALLAQSDGDLTEVKSWFVEAISQHHLGYGHGAIYTQKAFELAERMPELTDMLMVELALVLTYMTREDTLPYMRKALRAIDDVDLAALASTPRSPATHATAHQDAERVLAELLLDADALPVAAVEAAAIGGLGVEGIINAVSLTASLRLLRHDVEQETDNSNTVRWLQITHAMTYANAARWAWSQDPSPHAARLVLLTVWLAHDSGRGERRFGVGPLNLPEPDADLAGPGSLGDAIAQLRPTDAVAHALAGPAAEVADQLEAASMQDRGGSFIVMAHLVKTAVAARAEAAATESNLPLAAAARFMSSPRTERFVTVNVLEAIDFVQSGRPPNR